jgi:hypothetical protein
MRRTSSINKTVLSIIFTNRLLFLCLVVSPQVQLTLALGNGCSCARFIAVLASFGNRRRCFALVGA